MSERIRMPLVAAGSTARAIASRLIVVVSMAVLCLSACGPTGPTPPPPPPPPPGGGPGQPPAPLVTNLTLTGNVRLEQIGQTAQLTATATYSDGTTSDVSSKALWQSGNRQIIDVSPAGVLSVIAYGNTGVSAAFFEKSAGFLVIATPPGTFVASGSTRQPGAGFLPGVRVTDPTSAQTVVTGESGEFTIGALTGPRLLFERDGLEPVQLAVSAGDEGSARDVPMQSVIRIAVGGRVSSYVAPHDLQYAVTPNDRCEPCKLVRLAGSGAGTIRLTVTWTMVPAQLEIWAGGRHFAATEPGQRTVSGDIPSDDRETPIYVGIVGGPFIGNHVPFELTAERVQIDSR